MLGLGATGTLAAWTDSEFTFGVFNAGQFNIQGNESTATPVAEQWGDHYTAGSAASMQFSANFDLLAPGETVYAPFSVRIDPDKASYDATVHIQSAVSTGDAGLMSKLSWKARTGIDPATCAGGTYTGGGPLVPSPDGSGVAMNYAAATTPTTFSLSNEGAPAPTTPVTVCFAVTMQAQPVGTPPNDPDWVFTESVETTWQLAATSNS